MGSSSMSDSLEVSWSFLHPSNAHFEEICLEIGTELLNYTKISIVVTKKDKLEIYVSSHLWSKKLGHKALHILDRTLDVYHEIFWVQVTGHL